MATNEELKAFNLTFSQAGEILNCHAASVGRWAIRGLRDRQGKLQFLAARKFGGTWKTNISAIDDFVTRLTTVGSAGSQGTDPTTQA